MVRYTGILFERRRPWIFFGTFEALANGMGWCGFGVGGGEGEYFIEVQRLIFHGVFFAICDEVCLRDLMWLRRVFVDSRDMVRRRFSRLT